LNHAVWTGLAGEQPKNKGCISKMMYGSCKKSDKNQNIMTQSKSLKIKPFEDFGMIQMRKIFCLLAESNFQPIPSTYINKNMITTTPLSFTITIPFNHK
jgi:hypothetical protein